MNASFLFLIFGNDKVKFKRNRLKVEKVILKVIVSLSILFDIIAPILLVFIISVLNHLNRIWILMAWTLFI